MNHNELHSLMGTQAQLSHTSPGTIAGDHSSPTVPRNILSTDLRLASDREPGYATHAAGQMRGAFLLLVIQRPGARSCSKGPLQ